jgi:hypothetical protein
MDRERRGARIGTVAALTAALLVAGATEVAAAVTDVLTIGTVSISSGTGQVRVPIFIQDNTGTSLGRDQLTGFRISGFVLQVTYGSNSCIDTPASASQRIDLTGGILATQSADFDNRPKVANTSQTWFYSSAEANGIIPFTLDAPAPGDQIGAMVFNLTGCSAGTINLVITTTGGAAAKLNSDNGGTETVGNGGLSVVNGAINIGPPGRSLWTVAPCRVIDTRDSDGPWGGPALVGGSARTFAIANRCGIPADATVVSVNVTITNPSAAGHLTFYPTGVSPPLASTINFRAGQTRANNAILPLSPAGDLDVSCGGSGTVDLIFDVHGFFR